MSFYSQGISLDILAGGVTPLESPHTTGWRRFPFTVLACVSGGSALAEIKGEENHLSREGTALLIKRNIEHRITVTGETGKLKSHWRHFQADIFGSVDYLSFYNVPVALPDGSRLKELCAKMAETDKTALFPDKPALLQKYGFEILTVITGQSKVLESAAGFPGDIGRVRPALELMAARVGRNFYVGDAARAAGMSESRFFPVFSKIMGVSPAEYFDRLRMSKAAALLISSDMPASEIAEKLAYYDVFHFSKQFKKHAGESPLSYRKKIKDSMF
jgi:AraC-like DNA-binding protein